MGWGLEGVGLWVGYLGVGGVGGRGRLVVVVVSGFGAQQIFWFRR